MKLALFTLLALSALTLANPLKKYKHDAWCTFYSDPHCQLESHRTSFNIDNPGVFTSNAANSIICHVWHLHPPAPIWATLVACGDDRCRNEGERQDFGLYERGHKTSVPKCEEIGDQMRGVPFYRFEGGLRGPGVPW